MKMGDILKKSKLAVVAAVLMVVVGGVVSVAGSPSGDPEARPYGSTN